MKPLARLSQDPTNTPESRPWMQTQDMAFKSTRLWLQSLQNLSLSELSGKAKGKDADIRRMDLRFTGFNECCSEVINFVSCSPHGVLPTEQATGFLDAIASNALLSSELIDTLLDMSLSYDLELEPSLASCHNILTHQVSELTTWAVRFKAAGNDTARSILENLAHNPGLTDVGLTMLSTAARDDDDVLKQVLTHPNATEMVHRFIPARLVEAHLEDEARETIEISRADETNPVWESYEPGASIHRDFAAIFNPSTPGRVLDELTQLPGIRHAVFNRLLADNHYSCLIDGRDDSFETDSFLDLD